MALPTLISERLRLRAWTIGDAGAFHELWGDPRVIWWGHTPTPAASRQKLEEILARCAALPAGLGWWAVEARDSGRVVGNAVLQPAPYNDSAEVGYHLSHGAWGSGYATEAACAVLRHGFASLALPLISAVVEVNNDSSHRVISRIGMRTVGPIPFNNMPHILYELKQQEALALAWAKGPVGAAGV